ncbi:sirohydrochlorin cobaltochelatase [Clostridium sp. LIBA-8841]|uniref:sirohydrochlorin cobaltochelatase n=1 Tax=Clostridium sp. LIBA-8841 TaxID=2987530 RepID=UPI002AC4FCAC|nr:sirohydrochlorin cobaltochelatase [Clostridium sp. LIBA-8841]MDZ5253193.1 sirohydrochlorin cobaltochelatase [Clostridium sp. LIBA-8841]
MKKAILVVSFGTSHLDALNNSIKKIEDSIKESFEEYDVFRSFTSHMIVRKLKEKYDMNILFPEDALKKLEEEGYEEVVVQPLHIMPGEEFDYIKHMVKNYENHFKKIETGRPIFYYEGFGDGPNDYSAFVDSMKEVIEENRPCILVGHGSAHPSNAVYGCLQSVLDRDYEDIFVGTVEGYPNFSDVLKRVKKKNLDNVTIIPLMVVAGDHAKNDMASEDEDSWKSRLESEGIKTDVILKGLGEREEFRKLYIERVKDVIDGTYKGLGETKKRHRKVKR